MSGIALGLALTRERLRGVSAPLVLLLGAAAVFAWGVLLRRGHPSSAANVSTALESAMPSAEPSSTPNSTARR